MTLYNPIRDSGFRFKAVLLVVAGLAAAGASSAASAAPAADVPTLVVKYDADSLTTEAGARTLYHRLKMAANAVCGNPSTRDMYMNTAAAHCRNEAIAGAVARIHNTRLAAIATHSKIG